MGESSGDLLGVEYLNEYGFAGRGGENPFAVGAYVTGNKQRAIRNYNMSYARTGAFPESGVSPQVDPLNFSDIGYDLTGAQVHADGEIWSATNHDIRQALVAKYNATAPASNAALQQDCADGRRPVDQCPGNRRWIQIMFDAYLLMPTAPSMLQARDAYLAADRMRFGGANQAELWQAFARRGFGEAAASTNGSAESDVDPKPDFSSPMHNEAQVTFSVIAAGSRAPIPARIFVGHNEARVSPIADTDPATTGDNLDATAAFVPGTYEFVVRAAGYGHVRLRRPFSAGATTLQIPMQQNWASSGQGATASGDGVRHGDLIDDTEGTNWDCGRVTVALTVAGIPFIATSFPCKPDNPPLNQVEGAQVTVDLHGSAAQPIRQVNVSSMLRGQNRFTALREFQILFCDANVKPNCTDAANFNLVLSSGANAFPAVSPRPASPDVILRSWTIPGTLKRATHVRIRVVDNQCTGQTQFQDPGDPFTTDQDSDPTSESDCRIGGPAFAPIFGDVPQQIAPRNGEVHIAELQLFAAAPTVTG
jgi:extracellular elastinolytic metalloproteinase